MKLVYLTFLFLMIVSLVPFASAQLPTPDVTFIPEKISVNSSFLLVVDPGVSESVRVTWLTYGTMMEPVAGQIPKIGDKWMCYFSDTDAKSTCGPNPFRLSNIGVDPHIFEVNTTDSSWNTGGEILDVYVGSIVLTSKITTDIDNKIAYINVWPVPDIVTRISYETYYTNNLSLVPNKDGRLVYDAPSGAYRDNITLDIGQYYIAFSAPTSGADYGGSVARIDMSLGAGGDGNGEIGFVDVDIVSLNILINKNQKYEKSNYRITNLRNNTLTSLTVRIPPTEPVDVNDFLDIQLDNNTLGPLDSMFFSVVLENVVNSMEIKIQAQLKSNNSLIGYIPIDMTISVKNESGTTMITCEGKSDMSYCYGGICCDEICIEKSNCCDGGDCASDEECTNYICVKSEGPAPDIPCTTGTCYPDYTSCPTDETWTGTCREDGVDGICCEVEVNECEGQLNGTYCTDGVCCDETCITGECCDNEDCIEGEVCSYNYCVEPEVPEFDFTLLIIIVIIVVAAVGVWLYLKKYRKKGGLEEEFEEGTEEFEEEFY